MQRASLFLVAILILFFCTQKDKGGREQRASVLSSFPYIEFIDDELSEIIVRGSGVEIIAAGFDWTEGRYGSRELDYCFATYLQIKSINGRNKMDMNCFFTHPDIPVVPPGVGKWDRMACYWMPTEIWCFASTATGDWQK
jgi:hypothetical protein